MKANRRFVISVCLVGQCWLFLVSTVSIKLYFENTLPAALLVDAVGLK